MNSRPPQMIETHLPLPVPGAHWQWVCIEGDGTCATAPAAPADRQPADRPFWARQIMRGQIVGYYEDSADVAHGFRYSGGNYTTLDDPLATGVDFRFAQLDHEAAQPAAPVFPAQAHALASRAAGHRLSGHHISAASRYDAWHPISSARDGPAVEPFASRRAVAGCPGLCWAMVQGRALRRPRTVQAGHMAAADRLAEALKKPLPRGRPHMDPDHRRHSSGVEKHPAVRASRMRISVARWPILLSRRGKRRPVTPG